MRLGFLAALGVALAATGCGKATWKKATAKNVNAGYHASTEIPPGPGLFTGKTGVWEFELPDMFGVAGHDAARLRKGPRRK